MSDQTDEKTNLPAKPDEEISNIYKAAIAGRPPTLKFRKGEYFVGDDEVLLGRKFLVYAGDWRRGWRKWKDNQVVVDHVVRVADDPREPIERDDLDDNDKTTWPLVDGELRDPWQLENQLPVEDVQTGERLLFVTSSFGGKMAVENICGRYAATIRKGQDKGLPIVALATVKMTSKKWGKIPRPDFPIVGWENDTGSPIDVTPPPDGPSFDEEGLEYR